MSQQRAVQPLAEGALLAALTALLGVLSLAVPPLRFVTDFLWGIPIILVIIKHEMRTGIMVLTVSLLLMLFTFNPIMVFLFAVEMVPLAICYGVLIKKKFTAGKSLVIGVLTAIVAEVLTMLGFLYLAGINILPAQEELQRQVNEALVLYEKWGLLDLYAQNGISQEYIKQVLLQSVELITLLIPAALILSAIIRAFLTWIVSQRVLKRLGYKVDSLPKFTEWTLPWYWIWFLIIGLISMMIGDNYQIHVMSLIGKNAVAVTLFIYFIVGVGIALNLIKKWKLPGWLKGLIIIIGIINISGTIVLFTMLGIFDAFINLRKLNQTEDDGSDYQ